MGAKTIIGWHFAGETLRDGRPLPKKGDVLVHKGTVEPCVSGLHASVRLIDALAYAPGSMLAKVKLSGTIKSHGDPIDKYVASERTYLSDYVDVSRQLHVFACDVAEKALGEVEKNGGKVDPRSREAIRAKRLWLDGRATDDELSAAYSAAYSAADWAADWAARSAAYSAAHSTASWAARSAASWAARSAAYSRHDELLTDLLSPFF